MKKVLYLLVTLLFTLTLVSCKKGKQITLSYDKSEIEIFVGDEVNVKPIVEAGKKVKNYELNYELSNDIATIKDGKLTAKEKGTTVVTVTTDVNEDAVAKLTVVIKEKEVIPTEYKITLDADGGAVEKTEIKFIENEQVTLPVPTKDGYIFKGWYEGETKVEVIENKNYTLKALWEKVVVVYEIIYIAQGAKMPSDVISEFTDASEVTLPVPTKDGYIFKGWYEDGVLVETLENRNYTLKAEWEKEDTGVYTIEYKNTARSDWYIRVLQNRDELVEEFYSDLYKWAKLNGETRTQEEYKTEVANKLKNSEEIKLIDPELKDRENKKGGTEYFLNTSLFYNKWIDFFNLIREIALKKNSAEDIYYDAVLCSTRLHQYLAWTNSGKTLYMAYNASLVKAVVFSADVREEYKIGDTYELVPRVHDLDLDFLGWYDNPEFTGEPITAILPTDKGDKVFYARFEEEIIAEEVILNQISELLRYETYQLAWTFNPIDTTNKEVLFSSSNKNIATVDATTGLITAVSAGKTVISMKIFGNSALDIRFELEVYLPGQVQGSYDTTSYVKVNDVIKLNAELVGKGTTSLVWESKDESIAMVDQEGNVSGLKEGNTYIVARDKENEEIKLEFMVTVVSQEISDELELLLDSHNANIYTSYDLGIGAGTPEYYKDIFGSSSKLLSNYKLEINDEWYAQTQKTGYNGGVRTSTEWVTVHYTGSMGNTADAYANARYFATTDAASIHYTTGNDGIYYCTDEKYVAWHAGDGGSVEFKWYDTGLEWNPSDPLYPVFTISNDFYYEINGKKTLVEMARPYNYRKSSNDAYRNTDHILNDDGTLTAKGTYIGTKFVNKPAEEFINDQGLPFKVENGKYYIGSTWWCYTQVLEGRICSRGGNLNSVGIESCVNYGSDLWLTWQMTAKLVADIMIRYNLDITRVRGHHFFSGKDCPQPMLENDLEIWYEFLALVEAEHKLATEFNGYELTSVSNDTTYLRDNGRVRAEPMEDTCISYTITISNGDVTETITLGSILPGKYSR